LDFTALALVLEAVIFYQCKVLLMRKLCSNFRET